MTIGVPSYGGDQTQRLAAPVRKYVGLCNHQFRHPQQYASGHITVSPTQHCSLYILVQPNRTNAFNSFFFWFVIGQLSKLDRKWLPVKTAYIRTVIIEMFEYAVCKNISKHMQTLCKILPVLDIVEI